MRSCAKHMRASIRKRLQGLGYEEVHEWGGHSCRIVDGAPDLMTAGEATQSLLAAKGRWASDVGNV